MIKSGIACLQSLARADGDELADERVRAYAIYVLTRNGVVTSGFASRAAKATRSQLPEGSGRHDLAGRVSRRRPTSCSSRTPRRAAIIEEHEARRRARSPTTAYYYDPLAHDAQVLYLLSRHFPERAAKVTPARARRDGRADLQGSYNTSRRRTTILALEAYGEARGAERPDGALASRGRGAADEPLALPAGLLPLRAPFSDKASAHRVRDERAPSACYWLVSQRGFDPTLPDKAI